MIITLKEKYLLFSVILALFRLHSHFKPPGRQFRFQLVEWEETLTKLKEKLGGDDGPVEEVPFPAVLKHFQDVFLALKGQAQAVLFEGLPFQSARPY